MANSQRKWVICKVVSLRESEQEVVVSFSHIQDAILERTNPEYGGFLRLLRLSLDADLPVGITLSQQLRLMDVAGAERDVVVAFGETPSSPQAAAVWCTQDQFLLHKDHPRYRELASTLTDAGRQKNCLWLISKGGFVLDVLQSTPEADATDHRLFLDI